MTNLYSLPKELLIEIICKIQSEKDKEIEKLQLENKELREKASIFEELEYRDWISIEKCCVEECEIKQCLLENGSKFVVQDNVTMKRCDYCLRYVCSEHFSKDFPDVICVICDNDSVE